MKIVILPGVGYQASSSVYEKLASNLKKNIGSGLDTEIFLWQHAEPIPDFNLPYQDIRKFIAEVILDVQYVVLHSSEIELPEADYYVGHSAGSIICLNNSQKPCALIGSPVALVESLKVTSDKKSITDGLYSNIIQTMKYEGRKILNIVNRYDVLAYPIQWSNVENVNINGPIFNPTTYFPVSAHTSYWENEKVAKIIANKIKAWDKE